MAQSPKSMSLSDVASSAKSHALESFKNNALAPIQPLLHPIVTAKTFAQLADGLVSKAEGVAGVKQSSEKRAQREATANAIGNYYKDRYGSIEGYKKYVASDPFGALSDAASILSFGTGAAVKGTGALVKAAEVAGGAPLSAAKAASSVARGLNTATKVADASNALGWAAVRAPSAALNIGARLTSPVLSGVPSRSLELARKAGLEGNKAFGPAMRGATTADDIVDTADRAMSKIKAARDLRYANNKAYVKMNQTPISYDPIYKKLDDLDAPGNGYRAANGQIIDAAAKNTADIIRSKVDAWKSSPNGKHNAADFDDLKRTIGLIGNSAKKDPSLSSGVAKQIYGSIKGIITNEVPEYEKFMGDYSKASDTLGDLKSALSLGDTQGYSSGISKLSRAFKGGKGESLLNEISKVEPDLPYMLAGHAAQGTMPKSWGRLTSIPLSLGIGSMATAAVAHPIGALAGLYSVAQSSPRFAAGSALLSGKASRAATKWNAPVQFGVNAARQVENANISRPISLQEAGEAPGSFPVRPPTDLGGEPIVEPYAAPSEGPPNFQNQSIDAPISLDQAQNYFEESVPGAVEGLAKSLKNIESSRGSYAGNYGAIGQKTEKGSRAYGAYQIMDFNIPSWTKEALGYEMTPEQFLQDKDAQDQVAKAKIEQYYRKYGNSADVASAWHSGRPFEQAAASGAQEHLAGGKLGTKTTSYVPQVVAAYDALSGPNTMRESTGGRIERASGGRTSQGQEQLVQRLMAMAKRAKVATDKTTEPLLNAPDEAIVKALDVAQQAI